MFNTFYINLDKDQDRRKSIESQLQKLEITGVRFPAVDGRMLVTSSEYDEQESKYRNGKALTPGELGCALSHKACHQNALKADFEYTLVLEDDIVLPDNFKNILEHEIQKNSIFQKWEYLAFDYPPTGLIFILRWFDSVVLYFKTHIQKALVYKKIFFILHILIKMLYIVPLALFEGFRNQMYLFYKKKGAVSFYRPLYFAGCYVITKSAAKKLLDLEERIIYPADRVQNQARIKKRLKLKAFAPLVVRQSRKEFGSSILGVETIKY